MSTTLKEAELYYPSSLMEILKLIFLSVIDFNTVTLKLAIGEKPLEQVVFLTFKLEIKQHTLTFTCFIKIIHIIKSQTYFKCKYELILKTKLLQF